MSPHQTSFWMIAYDCLLEFHNFVPEEAQRAIREFRLKLSGLEGGAIDLIYHQEPFYLAAQLATGEAREPNEAETRQYEKILDRRTKEAAALGTDAEVIAYAKRDKAA